MSSEVETWQAKLSIGTSFCGRTLYSYRKNNAYKMLNLFTNDYCPACSCNIIKECNEDEITYCLIHLGFRQQLSIIISSPPFFAISLRTDSPIGERQMLPLD